MTTFAEVKEQERVVRMLELRCMERELLKKLQEDHLIDEKVVEEYRAEVDRMVMTIWDLKSNIRTNDSAITLSQNVIMDLGDKLEREKQTSEQLRIRLREVQEFRVPLDEKDDLINTQRRMLEDKGLHRSIGDLNKVIERLEHELGVCKESGAVNDHNIDKLKKRTEEQEAIIEGLDDGHALESPVDDKHRLAVKAVWLELP